MFKFKFLQNLNGLKVAAIAVLGIFTQVLPKLDLIADAFHISANMQDKISAIGAMAVIVLGTVSDPRHSAAAVELPKVDKSL